MPEEVIAPGNTEAQTQTAVNPAGDSNPQVSLEKDKPLLTPEGTAAVKTDAPLLGAEKTETEKKEEDKEKKPEDETPPDYSSIEYPEGIDGSDESKAAAVDFFTKAKLSPEQSQAVVNAFAERLKEQNARYAEAQMNQRKTWREEIQKSENFDTRFASARKGLAFACKDPSTAPLFEDSSWLTDHPGVFNLLARVGEIVGEDSLGAPASEKTNVSPEMDMYGEAIRNLRKQ